ncbi:phosphate transport system permease protein [Desulfomarina profundi]|uniref:Phosphate transport system permease protein n=1 Tax=Desulfomarina profundi TaxID=2772557 RepID=A0A8D5FR36_9BACT|nr:phosphate ABC transporter permease subunit PstC [Desulfomarina profundi]BCL59861.1 phosphate transport system permease protein [Desulfomarina profundi]
MSTLYHFILPFFAFMAASAYFCGAVKAGKLAANGKTLHSLPIHYGVYVAICSVLPALLLYFIWIFLEDNIVISLINRTLPIEFHRLSTSEFSLVINDIKNRASGAFTANTANPIITAAAKHYMAIKNTVRTIFFPSLFLLSLLSFVFTLQSIHGGLRARNRIEFIVRIFLIFCSGVAILTTLGIILSVLFESIHFFKIISLTDFLFGLKWSPQMAIRADQAGSSGAFGVIPLLTGTLLIASIAMAVAIPMGLLSAIYLSEYAGKRLRTLAKPILEILAGIPTVVYGFFAALTIAPLIRETGTIFHLSVSSESALAAGLVMGIMIIPFVSSLSDDVIHAVPQSLRDGSFALGATHFETIRNVIIPAALPGIVGSILLAVSRAIGETMIVVMAAGLSANLTCNPLQAVTTVTVQIVTLLVGDQEFDSPKTLAAFALGFLLFLFTLCLNVIALRVVRTYREHYE